MTKKKVIRIALIAAGVILAAAVIYFGIITWMIQTGRLVKWDNHWYTRGQLEEKYGPQYYEAEAKNTPEEVYSEFRQALINDEYEKALSFIVGSNRKKYREAFKDNDNLQSWITSLPKSLTKERKSGNYMYYNIDMGTENKNTITFVKNVNGYWYIESI